MKIKKIEVLPYDSNWPAIYVKEAALLKKILTSHCLETYHIGSTSIEGLVAKPSIDVICVVDHLQNSLILESNGYTYKKELNIPLRYYFSKNTPYSNLNLHVVEKDHGFIELNLKFRNYLRAHPEDVKRYADLKKDLLKDPGSFQKEEGRFSNYSLSKDTFIKDILKKAGYQGSLVNFCMHRNEWNQYHQMRKAEIFDPLGIVYDMNHPTITQKGHFHFVLYKGIEIVSCAHIEYLNESEAALRTISTEKNQKRKGYGTTLLKFLEKWLLHHSIKVLKLHANTSQISFYKKLNYHDMDFDDPCIHADYKNMGKFLKE